MNRTILRNVGEKLEKKKKELEASSRIKQIERKRCAEERRKLELALDSVKHEKELLVKKQKLKEYIVVYKNSSDEVNIELRRIKVKV